MKSSIKGRKLVVHHMIYALPDRKKRQGDLTISLTEGAHSCITDVQYSIAKDDLNAGLCLIFEGLKRVITCLQSE
jgi:hypothetical protein